MSSATKWMLLTRRIWRDTQSEMNFFEDLSRLAERSWVARTTVMDTLTGLTTHQELQQLVYSGLTPMQAILSVTKWAAEAWHLDKEIGTVAPGKFADLIIVNGDPLANIKNTRNVDLVILDGKVIDKALDPKWKNPIPTPPQECVGLAKVHCP